MGFSQGAIVSAIIIIDQMDGIKNNGSIQHNLFKFCIFFAGALPTEDYLETCNLHESELFNIPSIHIFGEEDDIIIAEVSLNLFLNLICSDNFIQQRSEKLANLFYKPTIVKHSGGHYCPTSANVRIPLKEFLSSISKTIGNK